MIWRLKNDKQMSIFIKPLWSQNVMGWSTEPNPNPCLGVYLKSWLAILHLNLEHRFSGSLSFFRSIDYMPEYEKINWRLKVTKEVNVGEEDMYYICVWFFKVSTFLCVSYFLSSSASLHHHVQQQATESLHHRVWLADLHLQEVGVVSVGWNASKFTECGLKLLHFQISQTVKKQSKMIPGS